MLGLWTECDARGRQTLTIAPTVADYMAKALVTVGPDLEIIKAMRILLERDVSGAPVVDSNGHLVGILSSRDCLRVAFNSSYYQEWGGTVAEYMSAPVETIDAATDVIAASQRFLNSRFRRFPVLRNGRLVGQISRHDILRALADMWSTRAV